MSNDALDPNDLLMAGGTPWASFTKVGDSVTGTVVKVEAKQALDFDTREPKTWRDGSPLMEVHIILATDDRDSEIEDDNGERRLVVNKATLKAAVRDAIRKAGSQRIEVGGVLAVTFTSQDKPTKRGQSGVKNFSATYTPAPSDSQAAADLLASELGAEEVDAGPGF